MDRRASPGLGPRHDASSRIQKPESAADKLAALKARVSAAMDTGKTRGGLNVGLHPALQDLTSSNKPSDSRGASGSSKPSSDSQIGFQQQHKQTLDPSAPASQPGKSNPYYDPSLGAQAGGKPRQSRSLVFNQKGKYIQQANALRRQAALEALKKKIAAQTRKAGIEEDIDVEKNFGVDTPPAIEWWDEGLVHAPNYDRIDDPQSLRILPPDTIITSYIQHPVAIEPPQDKHIPPPKPMYLTQKEQKKVRRQRRMQDMKEEQAKVRLGLVPAPAPKVKKSNLMRVLGEEAVKDPTAVEARVNREIAERHATHMQTNEERKLTKDQKHDKLATNQDKDAAKGLHMLAFRIDSLANGQHRYKINVNAEQHALTGIVIMHPRQNMVVVEGGAHSIERYKKLMLNRIDWTENAPSRDKETSGHGHTVNGGEALRQWLKAEDEQGELKDLAINRCRLIFEGEIKARGFRKWGSKVTESDSEARDVLARAKLDSFWNLAKSMQ